MKLTTSKFFLFSTLFWAIAFTAKADLFGIFSDETKEQERSAGTWAENEITRIDRPAFSLAFPKAWTLASDQPDYKPDRDFTIDAPGDSYINVKTFEARAEDDPIQMIKNMTVAFDGPLVETYSRSKFTKWGNFTGDGLHLKGKIMSMFPGGCRFFVGKSGAFGIIIVEYYFSEELQEVMPAFELIAQSFTVK